jgi:hypothetical protein
MCGAVMDAVMDAVMETTADSCNQQQARWTLAGFYVRFVSSNKRFLVVVQLQQHGCDDGVDDLSMSMPDSRGGYDNNQSAQTSIRSCFQQEDVVQCASLQKHQRRFQ